MNAYRNLRAGQAVTFWMAGGLSIKGREYSKRTARVQRFLVFADHVVVNLGGRHGTPYVVDDSNFISAEKEKYCVTRATRDGRTVAGIFTWQGSSWRTGTITDLVKELPTNSTTAELQAAYKAFIKGTESCAG